jgi:hypothetical protein
MSSRKTYLIIIFIIFFMNLSFCQYSNAYWNDWGSTKGTTALNVIRYRNSYYGPSANGKRAYFGTHDWLGESTLIILKEKSSLLDPQAQAFINMLYSDWNDLKMYFLLGTETPDAVNIDDHNINMYIYNCKGEKLNGRDIKSLMAQGNNLYISHNAVLIGGSPVPGYCGALTGAQRCWTIAVQALLEGDCRVAALFLGALVHFIADAGHFPHLYTKASWAEIGGTRSLNSGTDRPLKLRIARLTCKVERERGQQFENDFFSIQTAKVSFAPSVGNMGYFAALTTARYTSQYADEFMLNTQTHMSITSSPVSEEWWCDSFNLDSLLNLRNKHLEDLSASNPARYAYFKQLEAVLNEIILQCCYAINLAAQFYKDCDCGGGTEKELEKLQELTNTNTMQNTQTYILTLGIANIMASLMLISMILKSSKSELFPKLKL